MTRRITAPLAPSGALDRPTRPRPGLPKGVSGNPAGKKKGTRNKVTIGKQLGLTAASMGITPMAYAQRILDDPNEPARRKEWAASLIIPYVHRKQPLAVETRDLTREEEQRAADTVKKIEALLAEKVRARKVGAENVGAENVGAENVGAEEASDEQQSSSGA